MNFLKVLAVSAFVVLGLAQAPAHAFRVDGNVNVNPRQVRVDICNSSYDGTVMQCNATAQGYLASGGTLYQTGYFSVFPGRCQMLYVQVNTPYDYFVGGNGWANCNWVYPVRTW